MNQSELQTPPDNQPFPVPASSYRWLVVALLWFLCFFNYADRQAIFAIFPVLQTKYHFTKTELGIIGAAFTWVYAFAAPYAGHVGDRYPRKFVILGGLYVWSLITGLTAQCSKVWHFVLVRGSEGLGETFYMPASMAIISDYHGPATRSRAIGMHQTSIYAGTVGGSALAGWMAEKYGWQSPFWVLAVAGMSLGIAVYFLVREPQRNQAERHELGAGAVEVGQPQPMTTFLAAFVRTPTAVGLLIAFFFANMVGWVFLTWMPTFLTDKFHLKLAAAGLGATLFIQLFSVFGAALGGFVADHWSRTRDTGRILVQAIGVLLGTPFVFLCGYTRNPWLLIVAMSLFGLSKGVYDSNLTAAFYDVIPASRRSTATGLMNLVGFIGAGLGQIAIGLAVDRLKMTMSVAISSTAILYFGVSAILYVTAATCARRDIQLARQSALGGPSPPKSPSP